MSPIYFFVVIAISVPFLSFLADASPATGTAINQTSLNATTSRRSVREFLDAHNKIRAEYGVPLYTWARNLTRFARRWGNQRAVDCRMIHSYGPYGENLFWGKQNHWTPTEVVNSWVGENKFYDLQTNTCAEGRLCGHYTQVVWKETLRLGCARVDCVNGELLVICEYDPPGNYVNERPF